MAYLSLVTCFAAMIVLQPDPPTHTPREQAAEEPQSRTRLETAHARLVKAVDSFAAIVDCVNEKHSRAEDPRLYVDFIEATAPDHPEEDRTGLAPRADFIRVADLVHVEIERTGLLSEIAEIARMPTVEFPSRKLNEKPELKGRHMLRLFQYLHFGARRAASKGDQQGAARHVAALAGIASLWSDDPGLGRVVSVTAGSERLASTAIPLIVSQTFDRQSRRMIVTSLRDVAVDPVGRTEGFHGLEA